jgi:hypothetical protein
MSGDNSSAARRLERVFETMATGQNGFWASFCLQAVDSMYSIPSHDVVVVLVVWD